MRDFKLKLNIIWLLLTNKYTSSTKYSCWYLWGGSNKSIMITFDSYSKYDRESYIDSKQYEGF